MIAAPGPLTGPIAELGADLDRLRQEVGKAVVGQRLLVDRLLVALLAGGHVLVEGVPGLAKTTAVKALSAALATGFGRVQFTPDLLPADLIGTEVYRPQSADFAVKRGPIFTNLLLADEINRAPAKVQSALLEAMEERQVTIGEATYPLPEPFVVLATQNPIEHEGTYPLPEAQVDRFLFKLRVGYPSRVEEREILRRMAGRARQSPAPAFDSARLERARSLVEAIYLDEGVEAYVVDLVFATRDPAAAGLARLQGLIEYGASPRATIFLARAARAQAALGGRAYVTPQDIKTIAPDVLRHRVIPSYEAEARGLAADELVREILATVAVP